MSLSSALIQFDSVLDNSLVKKISDNLTIIIPPETGAIEDFSSDVKKGLTSSPKYLLPKYFYDSKGSELFEKITELDEYYPTEVERSIIKNIARILPQIDKNISTIVEIGSGSSNKTRHIIKSYSESRDLLHYIPIDISDIIEQSTKRLIEKFSNIKIDGFIADYYHGLEIVSEIFAEAKLYLFLGSSIGNFTLNESITFLSNIRSLMTAQDKLLIGFDLKKDRKVLDKAYDDSQGVTAKFNLNILQRINRELNANFDLDGFRHLVKFNEEESRIEMHLVSQKNQKVTIKELELTIQFVQGETIHTENSYKYTDTIINKMAKESGLDIVENFTDENNYFSLYLFQCVKYV